MGVRPDVRRHEYRLPADAPRGSPGHAAARLYLSAGAGVRAAEPRLDDRGFHAWLGGVAVSDRPCAQLPTRAGRRQCGQCLWRRDARMARSEERRVGKECVGMCKSRWSRKHKKKKKKQKK